MTTYEIERRLQLAAPDEPAVLPPLVLPTRSMPSMLPTTRVRSGAGVPPLRLSPRMVLVVVALLALLAVAVAAGALRLDLQPRPPGLFHGHGIQLAVPDEWNRLTPDNPQNASASMVALILTNNDGTACALSELPSPNLGEPVPTEGAPTVETEAPGPSTAAGIDAFLGLEDELLACLVTKPMQPGEARVVVSRDVPQLVGVGPIDPVNYVALYGADPQVAPLFNPTMELGWTERIDGMPAKLLVESQSIVPDAEQTRTWVVYPPFLTGEPLFIRATLRGPDIDRLAAQVDEIARSLRFDIRPVELAPASRDTALVRAIDDQDREARAWRGSDFFGCFPRTPGDRTVEITSGPDGPLFEPVTVTCTTRVEPMTVGLWQVTLLAAWSSDGGGTWGKDLFVAADGSLTGEVYFQGNFEVTFPGSAGPLPPPISGPIDLPPGSIVEVLPPGIMDNEAMQRMWEAPHPEVGDRTGQAAAGMRLAVVGGPISHEGTDWFQVELAMGTGYPSQFAWVPATAGGRPLLRIVEPRCPDGAVTLAMLLRLIPAERAGCFAADELELGPVIADRAPDQDGVSDGTPAWLAPDTVWRLFGEDGPEGLDGSLPVALGPGMPEIDLNQLLTVRGHFNDPASSGCERVPPESWGQPPEPRHVAEARCRELFVITSADPSPAP